MGTHKSRVLAPLYCKIRALLLKPPLTSILISPHFDYLLDAYLFETFFAYYFESSNASASIFLVLAVVLVALVEIVLLSCSIVCLKLIIGDILVGFE